jgi:hypothetical protein
MKLMKVRALLILTFLPFTLSATEFDVESFSTSLDYAQVIRVKAVQRNDTSWCFHTSVRHNDQSWGHYADGWEVTDLNGNQLGERPLAHPHDNEQPFTRSQCGINIPDELTQVVVRAKCNQHGFGGKPVVVDLRQPKGKGFTVRRR